MPEALERGLRAPRWRYGGLVGPLSTARVFRKFRVRGRPRPGAALISASPSSPSTTAHAARGGSPGHRRGISGTPSRPRSASSRSQRRRSPNSIVVLSTSSVTWMPGRAGRSFVCASSGAFTRPAEACASSSARRSRRTSPKPPADTKSAPGLGSESLRAVDVALAEIARMPQRHPVVRGRARRALMRRFPYGVFLVARANLCLPGEDRSSSFPLSLGFSCRRYQDKYD